MKFKSESGGTLTLVASALAVLAAPLLISCDYSESQSVELGSPKAGTHSAVETVIGPESVARLLSRSSFGLDQVREVWNAVRSSSDNGYDEEYLFSNLLSSPGTGVGDLLVGRIGSQEVDAPLAEAVLECAGRSSLTRGVQGFRDELASSGLQIYWPNSEVWDGKTMPVITFNPENGQERVKGFRRSVSESGKVSVEEIFVDEEFAAANPVWVVNRNEDAGYLTPKMLSDMAPARVGTRSLGDDVKTLKLKDLKPHRNYDTWLAGASEFVVKCGSLENFKAETMDELKNYSVSMSDFVVVVKRKQVGYPLRLNSVLVSDWTDQLVNCGFIMIEDDGGARTSWKCTALVKVKSKSTGVELELPYRKSDDIVWRGTLSKNYLESIHNTPVRLGDVSITFTLD